MLIAGGVLWLEAHKFNVRPNVYLATIAGTTTGYFVAREVSLPGWQLVTPGL